MGIAHFIKDFLVVFHNATKAFSHVYNPTFCKVTPHLHDIYHKLVEYSKYDLEYFRDSMLLIKNKFGKYWGSLPILWGIATVLHPSYKVTFLSAMEIEMYEEKSANELVMSVQMYIIRLYDEYQACAGPILEQVPQSSSPAKEGTLQHLMNISKKIRVSNSRSGSISGSEFQDYLMQGLEEDHNLDILSWWKSQEHNFPILSKIA